MIIIRVHTAFSSTTMRFVNNYKPTVSNPSTTEPYDINFVFPIPPVLETSRVKLVPHIPSLHAEAFIRASVERPELSRYLPVTFTELSSWEMFVENLFRVDSSCALFTIVDKTKCEEGMTEEEILRICGAGIIGLIHASPSNRSVEIGPVIVLPAFQKTFVATNAVGILLRYCLDLAPSGLGLRRVQWTANPDNAVSVRFAEKIGMQYEGRSRWTWVMESHKEGKQVSNGRGEGVGRDSVIYALCWDDWEGGAKEHVGKTIDRI